MSMLEWVKKDNCNNLILFVHGLKGGSGTWSYDEKISFPLLLKSENNLVKDHDIACFEYFTTFTNAYGNTKSLMVKLFSSVRKKRKNLPIDEIGELLKTEIHVNLCNYENIIIIAHSMGGLVSKSCILKQLDECGNTPVKGFISLAVPHSGAKMANIGGMITKNVQIKDLSIFSDAITSLTRDWIHAQHKPKVKYIYAAHDNYVDKKSASAIDSIKKESMAVDEDHSSICKPKDKEQTVYNAVLGIIFSFHNDYNKSLEIENFTDNEQYDDEYFVLKMIIADVHERITGHAKEYFYNAELVRKIFTSDEDRKKLESLYTKVKHIYQGEYEKFIAGKSSSDTLIASVNSRIMNENNGYLASPLFPVVDSIHKKGMLQQLANNKDKVIIWSSELDLNKLEQLKAKK